MFKYTISVYSPTNTSENKKNVEAFYNSLEEILNKVKGKDSVVLLGDFNATTGKNRIGIENIIGHYTCNTAINRNGTKLLDLLYRHKLAIANTFFKKTKPQHTFYGLKTKRGKKIDFIIIKQRDIKKMVDCEVKDNLHITGHLDHELVQMKIHARTQITGYWSKAGVAEREVIDREKTENGEIMRNLESHGATVLNEISADQWDEMGVEEIERHLDKGLQECTRNYLKRDKVTKTSSTWYKQYEKDLQVAEPR